MKPVSRIALIMTTALFFTPVYSLSALADDGGFTVNPNSWVYNVTGPNGACYSVYNNNGSSSLYVPYSNSNEWSSFYNSPGAASLAGCSSGDDGSYGDDGNSDGDGGAAGDGDGCFLAGAKVAMADGTMKPIEQILPGDMVRGRYGEANVVLALAPVLLGKQPFYLINCDHYTTNDHPHWTPEGPVALRPESLATYWGREHPVVLANRDVVPRQNYGLTRRVGKLSDDALLIALEGLRPVTSIERVAAAPGTQLYNLVLGGSHTYFVDGYLVTGWPREDDFDYDRWQPRDVALPRSFLSPAMAA